mgnify:FL=1
MNMNCFFNLAKTRRSIRKFLPQKVEPEKISMITKVALMAPASKRSNPWEFVVVQQPEMLQKLSLCRPKNSQFLAGAPLAIVVLADTEKSNVWMVDAAIASIMMQLQAHDLGLGSCWIHVHDRQMDENTSSEDYIRGLLQIPSQYAILNILAVGYPNETKNPHDEEKLAYEKVHFEKF